MTVITATRSGIPVIAMPTGVGLSSVSWEQLGNTQIAISPTTQYGQVNELPGLRWLINAQFKRLRRCDPNNGRVRAWFLQCRGAARPFFMVDPLSCRRCSTLGSSKTVSKTVTVPAIPGGGAPLYPQAADLYPESSGLYPSGSYGPAGLPEYVFTLTAGFNAGVPLVVASAASAGATSISVGAVNIGYTFTNSSPWDYSQGVRPGYEEALTSAMVALSAELGYNPADGLLNIGDTIQVGDQFRVLVAGFGEGDTSLTFEPPLMHPVSAGAVIDYQEPGVILRLVDDQQVRWGAQRQHVDEPMAFSAVEWIE